MSTFVEYCSSPSKSLEMPSNDLAMPIIADVRSVQSSKRRESRRTHRTCLVNYGPIAIRKRQTMAPTLETGRRSKDALLSGEDVIKRDIRRRKNRESARNLKKVRDHIEQNLESQIRELETEQERLVQCVSGLRSYKEYLQTQRQRTDSIYNIILRTAEAVLAELKQKQREQLPVVAVKEESRSPFPHWQEAFHI